MLETLASRSGWNVTRETGPGALHSGRCAAKFVIRVRVTAATARRTVIMGWYGALALGWYGVLVGAAVLALLVGYLVHRWRFLVGLVVLGVLAIIVDVSTRDLVGSGHDDRGLAAMTEGFLLVVLAALVAVGITLGRRRAGRARGRRS